MAEKRINELMEHLAEVKKLEKQTDQLDALIRRARQVQKDIQTHQQILKASKKVDETTKLGKV